MKGSGSCTERSNINITSMHSDLPQLTLKTSHTLYSKDGRFMLHKVRHKNKTSEWVINVNRQSPSSKEDNKILMEFECFPKHISFKTIKDAQNKLYEVYKSVHKPLKPLYFDRDNVYYIKENNNFSIVKEKGNWRIIYSGMEYIFAQKYNKYLNELEGQYFTTRAEALFFLKSWFKHNPGFLNNS